jgi:hypothetical protein
LGKKFEIKITFIDSGTNEWRLVFQNETGIIESVPITGKGNEKVKTATFSINSSVIPMKKDSDADFMLRVDSGEDLTVEFVRVVK